MLHEYIRHMLGSLTLTLQIMQIILTIFGEYVKQQDSVCGSKVKINRSMCVHGNKRNMSLSATVWLIDVFLIVFGQHLRSMVQRN